MPRRTTTRRHRPPTLIGAATGAYLIPAVTTYVNARLIDKPDLALAAWTTIAAPSAVAAVGATVLARRASGTGPTVRAVARSAVVWALAAAGVTGWMVGNGWVQPLAFTQIPVSAAVGAAIATRKVRRSAPHEPQAAQPASGAHATTAEPCGAAT